ncbi:MAG: HPF/RaiA family ribosome-associated protein [Actinomycetota bacterium]|nr:HPF/RaiA family ribosome-associated protein [Actinomycetota bacterium]
MDIAFRARHVEVPESLRLLTLAKVTRLAAPCAIDRVDVCFWQERNPRIAEREVCEITLFAPGRVVRAHAAATDVAVAAERVVNKLAQRADRLRGRRSGRRYPRPWAAGLRAPSGHFGSVHFRANWTAAGNEPGAVDQNVGDAGEAADMGIRDSSDQPMTPEEAALEMGERGSDIFFFLNAETDRPAVVYRRMDGNIALFAAAVEARL